ncbi:T9SS type A sorting domain-containing protein [Barnesiella propionica]|nr:T9SS type A sorting domain-containing protein [Barnesiella propionica]MCU6767782.1 T9SS type A sorting domain-containing protein [Barnesiella propionica]
MRIDKSVCPNNTLRSAVIVEDSQVETLPTFLINEAETVYYDKVRLYPNPTSGIVNIITSDGVSQVKTISIYDVTGKLLKNYMNFTENRLDLFGFNDGMYFLKIRTSLGLTTHKIIIEK